MLKILNELVEIPINDRLIPADKITLAGTIRPLNTSELTPHWDKILFGIKLSLIDCNFLPAAAIESKTGRLDLPASFSPSSLIPGTPQ